LASWAFTLEFSSGFDKNTKDYDTLKWEEELRAQLAEKKGQSQKKLTPIKGRLLRLAAEHIDECGSFGGARNGGISGGELGSVGLRKH
jgi:hypothetical protein